MVLAKKDMRKFDFKVPYCKSPYRQSASAEPTPNWKPGDKPPSKEEYEFLNFDNPRRYLDEFKENPNFTMFMKSFREKRNEETKESIRQTNLGNLDASNKYLFLELEDVILKLSEEEIPDLPVYYYMDKESADTI